MNMNSSNLQPLEALYNTESWYRIVPSDLGPDCLVSIYAKINKCKTTGSNSLKQIVAV